MDAASHVGHGKGCQQVAEVVAAEEDAGHGAAETELPFQGGDLGVDVDAEGGGGETGQT